MKLNATFIKNDWDKITYEFKFTFLIFEFDNFYIF